MKFVSKDCGEGIYEVTDSNTGDISRLSIDELKVTNGIKGVSPSRICVYPTIYDYLKMSSARSKLLGGYCEYSYDETLKLITLRKVDCSGTLVIPNFVEVIEKNAFVKCQNILKIEFESISSLRIIEDNAFAFCKSLREIDLEACVNLEEIGLVAFSGCSDLKSISLPDNEIRLKYGCFSYCGLTNIKLSSKLKELGDGCFNTCRDLTSIVIPSSVESLGVMCFGNCNNLKEVKFEGRHLKRICYMCFEGTPITEVVIPEGVDLMEDCITVITEI